eukprot:TRINITY_DN10106_c0_g1_i4.p3 TRINITY_DN10106_c0_g1~~TRINITY_DN10106_c0_g1_i4.p3  ORF type:complete len:285 (-),score=61.05 TRINITY_DN10106_c0_g1_i4:30-884(-)
MISREQLIEKVRNTSSIPAASAQALKLLNDPDAEVGQVTKCFQYDPGMTANIIKLANSSLFPAVVMVKSLPEAIIRIGFRKSLQLLIGMSFSRELGKPVSGYDLDAGRLLESAVSGAVFAEVIARNLGIGQTELLFTSCMLRDVGKMVLGSMVEVDVDKILAEVSARGVAFEEAERDILGIDHSEAGALLMESWNMPEEFIATVKYHHHPTEYQGAEAVARMIKIVHIADILSVITGDNYGVDGLDYRLDNSVAEELGINCELSDKIIYEQKIKFDELKKSGII